MARRVKAPLEMGNGEMVRTMEQLRENFDLEKVLEYLVDGRLMTWLEERYYTSEAERVAELDVMASDRAEKICDIFGVECPKEMVKIDEEKITEQRERLNRLRQYTDDQLLLSKISKVAFNQEELAEMLDDNSREIYLCGETFHVPVNVEGVRYIGVNKPEVMVDSMDYLYEPDKEITIENCNVRLKMDFQEVDELPECENSIAEEKVSNNTEKNKYSPVFESGGEGDSDFYELV